MTSPAFHKNHLKRNRWVWHLMHTDKCRPFPSYCPSTRGDCLPHIVKNIKDGPELWPSRVSKILSCAFPRKTDRSKGTLSVSCWIKSQTLIYGPVCLFFFYNCYGWSDVLHMVFTCKREGTIYFIDINQWVNKVQW